LSAADRRIGGCVAKLRRRWFPGTSTFFALEREIPAFSPRAFVDLLAGACVTPWVPPDKLIVAEAPPAACCRLGLGLRLPGHSLGESGRDLLRCLSRLRHL
jgi:hypothetical protein